MRTLSKIEGVIFYVEGEAAIITLNKGK